MKKTDLEVFNEMVKANQDIKCTTTVIESRHVRGGASLSFGIDRETHANIANSAFGDRTHYAIAFVVNKEQFVKLKAFES